MVIVIKDCGDNSEGIARLLSARVIATELDTATLSYPVSITMTAKKKDKYKPLFYKT